MTGRYKSWGIGVYEYRDEQTGEIEKIYGYPPLGCNPRCYTPDYQLCSLEEIQNWKEDLEEINKGNEL
jgi:hypothetical protein